MRLGWLVLPVLAMGPFEKNHPLVDDGEAAFERGDFDAALEKFEAADKEVPNNAQIAFDRGTALHKLGRNEDARAAFMKAAELNQGKQPLDSDEAVAVLAHSVGRQLDADAGSQHRVPIDQ